MSDGPGTRRPASSASATAASRCASAVRTAAASSASAATRPTPPPQGYTCEKALRLDHYQNGRHRLTSPLRRRADGTFEEIDWDTAIAEVAAGFAEVRDTHGGESIFYYGGGGQGNHLGGAYGRHHARRIGSRYRSNALAQEKTGEFWVERSDARRPRARRLRGRRGRALRRQEPLAEPRPRARPHHPQGDRQDPARSMIVLDPRRTETAELADFHLPGAPGDRRLVPGRPGRRAGGGGTPWT